MNKMTLPCILAVDDNERNVRLLDAMLSPHGYQILPAYSGHEALQQAKRQPLDLVILDIVMPGMDGYEVARILRADPEYKALPILMLTALRDGDDMAKALAAGADDFLTKPFSFVELLTRVRSLVRIKHLQDELQLKNMALERATLGQHFE